MMRQILISLFLTAGALAEPVQLLDGKLSLDVPTGFVELTAADIARKFPPTRPPKVAFANNREHMTVTIAVTLSNSLVKAEELPQFGQFLKKSLAARGQVESDGITEIAGRQWYRLVLQTQAVDQPIRNEFLVTPMGSQLMMLNFNATQKEYPQYRKALEQTAQSLQLKSP